MGSIPIWQTILISLFSGIVGAIIPTVIYIKRENRKFKVDTLKKYAANRYDLSRPDFLTAINEIFIVFSHSKDVLKFLQEYHNEITSSKRKNVLEELMVKLYKAMCDDVKISYGDINDSFFLTPFNYNEQN